MSLGLPLRKAFFPSLDFGKALDVDSPLFLFFETKYWYKENNLRLLNLLYLDFFLGRKMFHKVFIEEREKGT